MRYAVLGAGRQGTAAAHDMAVFGDADEIRLIDSDEERAGAAARRINELAGHPVARPARVDVREESAITSALEGVNAVLSAVPYFFNVGAARAAVAAGCHFNDLGGNTTVVMEELALTDVAERKGVSIVPDCGLAPGMGNSLAAYGIERFDRAQSVRILCGGLPQDPKPPLGYKQVFSLEGLTNEYTGEAIVLRNGAKVTVPAFTGLETVDVPGLGTLEAFYTSGGTSTCPDTYAGRLDEYEYKTLRYPGHFAAVRPLIDLGLLDREPIEVGGVTVRPRDVVHAVLGPRIQFPGDPDLVVLIAEIRGMKDGRPRTLRMTIRDKESSDTGFTAMERTTAYPASIVTIL